MKDGGSAATELVGCGTAGETVDEFIGVIAGVEVVMWRISDDKDGMTVVGGPGWGGDGVSSSLVMKLVMASGLFLAPIPEMAGNTD